MGLMFHVEHPYPPSFFAGSQRQNPLLGAGQWYRLGPGKSIAGSGADRLDL